MIKFSRMQVFGLTFAAAVIAGCSGGTEVVGLIKGSAQSSGGEGGAPVVSAGSGPIDAGGMVSSAGSAGSEVGNGGSSGTPAAGGSGAATGGGAPAAGSGGTAGSAGTPSMGGTGGAAPTGPINVLVWNYTTSFGHQSRETAIPLLKTAGMANNINFDMTYALDAIQPEGPSDAADIQNKLPGTKPVDTSVFSDAGLDKYDVVYFLNTTGNPLNADGADKEKLYQQALIDFMEKKHRGFMGTHSATDTFHGGDLWQWYLDMMGCYFTNHSGAGTQGTASIKQGVTHVILTDSGVPNPWSRQEEWYQFSSDVTNLPGFTILELAHETTTMPNDRPSAWVHNMDGGGRVFYSAFGHDVSAFKEPAFMKFLISGTKWAAHRL